MNTHAREPGVSTSYIIGIGYNSGASCDFKFTSSNGFFAEAWELLKSVVIEICNNPNRIVEEARKFSAAETCANGTTCCTLEGHAEKYRIPWTDRTIAFDEKKKEVVQMASGDRLVKEHIRRAFCRLVINEMHKHNIEVNLMVV
jgi:hypothetical protein